MGEQSALVVPLELLIRQPTHPLHETAFDLPTIDPFIDRVSHIVQNVHPQHPVHARETVHLDFADRRAAREIMKWLSSPSHAIPVDAGSSVITRGRQTDAFQVSLSDDLGKGDESSRAPATEDPVIRKNEFAQRRFTPSAELLLQ